MSIPTRLWITILICCYAFAAEALQQPLRLGVVGLTHTHVHWILGRENRNDVQLVGIVEPNRALAARYTKQYGLPISLVYNTMEEMYETSWYPSNHEAYRLLQAGTIGSLRKLVVRDGHRGPKNIGINQEFLDWLTDSVQNGGGAFIDFGCYGANLSTWLMQGRRPKSVTAVLQQLQPDNNPAVDDEATIILTYDTAHVIIQASWNWPIGRKDMEVYGLSGAIFADSRNMLRLRMAEGYDGFSEKPFTLPEMTSPYNDPFAYFAAVINREISIPNYGLYSLENNLLVVEILEAARESARSGKTIRLGAD
jgi:predicted dehydrogenase